MKKMKMEMDPCTCFCMNRLPDEILIDIFSRISDAKKLFQLSIFCNRFASLIPYHSASTITLQLPQLVGKKIFLRYKFIASFKKFVDKFRYKHTLHLKLTREFYNVDIFFEFMPDNNKSPQVLILSSIISGMEKKLEKIYYPFFENSNSNTTYYFPPLFPGYHACGRWEEPLMMLLSDTKAEEQPWINEYKYKLALPESESVKKKMMVMLSATRAAWGDDGVFFRNNIRGKDAVLLEAVREVMNWYF